MTDTPALRKSRGAFFTPPQLAEFITRWAIRTPYDRVLEPSCGEAAFLVAAAERLRHIGGHPDADQLHGTELHEPSARAAADIVRAAAYADAAIQVGDFLAQRADPAYAAVIGNPPYVRYQDFTGASRAVGQEAALAAGVRLTGLASAWAPFVVHAAEFVEPSGRLGLVLPAELLTVGYAAGVRDYLLRRFGDVRLVLFEQRVFPGVLEEVVLLLAEGVGPTNDFKIFQARDGDDLADVDRLVWTSSTPARDAKWMPALLDADSFDVYQRATTSGAFPTLAGEWGKTGLGAVTGNNRWFAMTAAKAHEHRIGRNELVAISPPGSKHLRGLKFTTKAWKHLVDQGRRGYLFYPGDTPSPAAERYIAAGEEHGVHTAYKCRVRRPWWRVPLASTPDLFLTYMNHVAPQLTTNVARARHLNSIHGVTLRDDRADLGRDLLPLAALNSVTLLGAEMVGRSYGGGILKLEPREADRWPMPSADLVDSTADDLRALRPQLLAHLRRGDVIEAARHVDHVLLRAAGLRTSDLTALRAGRELLFHRRAARGSS